MNRTGISIFALGLCVHLGAQTPFTPDAIELTLRHQEGIRLDTVLARELEDLLAGVRTAYDTLNTCNAFYRYVFDELLVKATGQVQAAWNNGILWTLDAYIDSLGHRYHLVAVHPIALSGWFNLSYSHPLQMVRLGNLYSIHPDIVHAEPNYWCCDGDDIYSLRKAGIWHLVFSNGWGDCLAGCICRDWWYVRAERDSTPVLLEMLPCDHPRPHLYRWNIPPYYAMTMFPDADSIYATVLSAPEWWVRRHAVEGLWRFYIYEDPWTGGEDLDLWNILRAVLLTRLEDTRLVLQQALGDPDPEVAAAAVQALEMLEDLSADPQQQFLTGFALARNFPNPFNSATTIRFELTRRTYMKLAVYDLQGREVAVLRNEIQPAGIHHATWDAGEVATGIYFYRLTTPEGQRVRKCVVLK